MPIESPDISIVIVSFNTKELLRQCLETTMQESQGLNYEIIVIDNASKDCSAELVAIQFPQINLIKSKVNLGFAAANNIGFKNAKGRYIVLLNTDAFLHPGTLRKAVIKMDKDPDVGMAGAKLVSTDGSWQPSARMFPSLLNDFLLLSGLADKYPDSKFYGRADRTWASPEVPAEIDWVPGAFSIIRKSVLEKVGNFDERFFLYYEEVDLCRRIKSAGYSIWYWPDLVVTHIGGESSKTIKSQQITAGGSQLALWRMRSAYLYYRKHHGFLYTCATILMELWWHQLRYLKNLSAKKADSQFKMLESQNYIKLLKQAWKETKGGKLCPPKPW